MFLMLIRPVSVRLSFDRQEFYRHFWCHARTNSVQIIMELNANEITEQNYALTREDHFIPLWCPRRRAMLHSIIIYWNILYMNWYWLSILVWMDRRRTRAWSDGLQYWVGVDPWRCSSTGTRPAAWGDRGTRDRSGYCPASLPCVCMILRTNILCRSSCNSRRCTPVHHTLQLHCMHTYVRTHARTHACIHHANHQNQEHKCTIIHTYIYYYLKTSCTEELGSCICMIARIVPAAEAKERREDTTRRADNTAAVATECCMLPP